MEAFSRGARLEVTRRKSAGTCSSAAATQVLVFIPRDITQLTAINGAMVPLSGSHGAGHLAFRVALRDFAAWREHLRAQQSSSSPRCVGRRGRVRVLSRSGGQQSRTRDTGDLGLK